MGKLQLKRVPEDAVPYSLEPGNILSYKEKGTLPVVVKLGS